MTEQEHKETTVAYAPIRHKLEKYSELARRIDSLETLAKEVSRADLNETNQFKLSWCGLYYHCETAEESQQVLALLRQLINSRIRILRKEQAEL